MAKAEFFSNISNIIENNNDRLSYGISVTDFDKDGSYEFIVAGFGYPNLALSYKKGKLINTCLLYTSPSPRDLARSRMPSSA